MILGGQISAPNNTHLALDHDPQPGLAHPLAGPPATADDWTERYNTTPVLIETFVETPRFTGALSATSSAGRVAGAA